LGATLDVRRQCLYLILQPNKNKLVRHNKKPRIFLEMKPNIDSKGRAARGGIAVVFLLTGVCLVSQAPVFAGIFILIGLFCAFEAWRAWCAIRACGIKLPF